MFVGHSDLYSIKVDANKITNITQKFGDKLELYKQGMYHENVATIYVSESSHIDKNNELTSFHLMGCTKDAHDEINMLSGLVTHRKINEVKFNTELLYGNEHILSHIVDCYDMGEKLTDHNVKLVCFYLHDAWDFDMMVYTDIMHLKYKLLSYLHNMDRCDIVILFKANNSLDFFLRYGKLKNNLFTKKSKSYNLKYFNEINDVNFNETLLHVSQTINVNGTILRDEICLVNSNECIPLNNITYNYNHIQFDDYHYAIAVYYHSSTQWNIFTNDTNYKATCHIYNCDTYYNIAVDDTKEQVYFAECLAERLTMCVADCAEKCPLKNNHCFVIVLTNETGKKNRDKIYYRNKNRGSLFTG